MPGAALTHQESRTQTGSTRASSTPASFASHRRRATRQQLRPRGLQWTGPLLAGLLADLLGPPGGALVLAVAVIPFGASLDLAKCLRVLDQSLDEVTEFPVPQGCSSPSGCPAGGFGT